MKTVHLTLRLPEDLCVDIDNIAAIQRTTRSRIIVQAVLSYVNAGRDLKPAFKSRRKK